MPGEQEGNILMVELRAFQGILYNRNRIGDLSAVVCPPYDVISPAEQELYYSLHPCNAIRLDWGKDLPEDSEPENRYTRAARLLDAWLSDGVLVKQGEPGYYLLEEEFREPDDGSPVLRHGLIGLLGLEEAGPGAPVRLHELTHAGPKQDRLELMKSTRANLSQVFALYQDPSGMLEELFRKARAGCACGEASGRDGVERRLFFLGGRDVQGEIEAFFRDKSLFIADGHHRYETALVYRGWRRARAKETDGAQPWDYILMYLTNSEGAGLRVYPTHRILTGYPGWDADRFLGSAREVFQIEETGPAEEPGRRMRSSSCPGEHPDESVRIRCFLKGRGGRYLLSLREPEKAACLFPAEMHPLMRSLDVSLLHEVVLGRVLGMSREAQEKGGFLLYAKGEDAAIEMVESQAGHQAAFLLGPPDILKIMELSALGIRMPQKTTYFYPKLLTGLVFRRIEEG